MNRVEVERKVLNENQVLAEQLRGRYREQGLFCVNLISAPGSGKTLLLEKTLERIQGTRLAVLTGDLQTENDATRLARFGFPVRQIITGGTCHLDAKMIGKHLDGWELANLDLLIIENVGNLVCPSSYDLGEDCKIVLLSTTEGEDKPLKYPSIFAKAELMLLTKIDLLPYVQFNADLARENARRVHPQIEIIDVSSTTGAGLEQWLDWLRRHMYAKNERRLLQAGV
jgi:hydrogenase nickel incorporation protein HypB